MMRPTAEPLRTAAKDGDLDAVQKLLQQEPPVDVNEADEDTHFTALYVAARAGHALVVELLLQQPGIDVNFHVHKTALCIAAQNGHVAIVKLLLAVPGIDVNAGYAGLRSVDYWGAFTYSPLHAATTSNHLEIVKLLLDRPEIEVNANKSFRELTPLHVALWKPNGKYSRPLKKPNKVSRSCFHADESRREVVLALLAHKNLNANLENRSRHTQLHYMVFFDAEIDLVVRLLRRPEVDVNARGEGNMTPLHHAAVKGNLEMIQLFLRHPRIIVNFQDMYRSTPLFAAAEKGMAAAAQLLLEKGADIHAVSSKPSQTFSCNTPYHNTPLYCAAEGGHKDMVVLLLKQPGIQSEIAPTNKNWLTPLHAAASRGHSAVVKLLLRVPEVRASLIDATKSSVKSTTALHLACKHGHAETAASLLSYKEVNVNVKNGEGFTPLHLAIRKGHIKVVKLLLNKFAEVDFQSVHLTATLRNEVGLTIASLLAEKNREAILQHVEEEKDPLGREFLEKVLYKTQAL
jgi:ankyrin